MWILTPVGSWGPEEFTTVASVQTLIDHPRDYRGPWGPTDWQATLADGPARNRTVCASRALSPSSVAALGGARVSAGDAPCSPP